MNPLVSIIMPSYNSKKFISETIESILSQSYPYWELLITDDCSSDQTVDIILSYISLDSRIKLYGMDSNQGAAVARNNSIKNAIGKYIAFCDSDDIWHPDKLKTQIDFMQKNNYAFTFTSYSLIYENGNEMHKIISAISSIRYEEYLKQTIIGCSTVIINRDVVGNFTMPKLVRAEDMGLWVNIMKRGFLAYGLHKCLTKYRVRSEALSSNKIKQFQSIWVVYRQLEGFSIIKSVYYSCFYAINAIKKRYFNRCKLSLQ